VGAEVVVGLCVERSLSMVVGLLGILKAGGAYLPLDPGYPPERLSFMLSDAGAALLVTHAPVQGRVSVGLPRVLLDEDAAQIATHPETPPAVSLQPQNLAYIIYTSGSTGKPKGVMTCHGMAINYLHYYRTTYDIALNDTLLQLASISFDASVRDLYSALLVGGRVVILAAENTRDA
jgi:non-ribosomal peptide synthetase component F